jgi:hypothetical protein
VLDQVSAASALLTAMLQKAAITESITTPAAPTILKIVDDALSAFGKVHPEKSILLLSPYLKRAQNIDPFETLGRGMERYHARIRHVPYVPRAGLTGIHQKFLESADTAAVVVVVAGGAEEVEMEEFARGAWTIAAEFCPMILVFVDRDSGTTRSCGFGTVIGCAGLRTQTLWEASDLIFSA